MSLSDQPITSGTVEVKHVPAKGERKRAKSYVLTAAWWVMSLAPPAAMLFGPPEVQPWVCAFSFVYCVNFFIAAVVGLVWFDKQRTLSWMEYTQTLSDDAERRFRDERDRWSAEMARLRAETKRKLAEAEAVLSDASTSLIPVADPADVLARLSDLNAHITADVGPDGAVTVVLRPKVRSSAGGAF